MALRVGFLSTANIGTKNFIAISKATGVEVTAVSSRSLEKAKAWADERGVKKAYGSHDELLADPDIDAVYVPMPTGVRADIVIKAAKAGKHVMCEKPIAPTVKEAQSMIEACKANNVVFMDGVMFMHNPRLNALRSVMDRPEFGKTMRVVSDFSFNGDEDFMSKNIRVDPKLEPMGALGDLGVYNTRFALFVFGWRLPESVSMIDHDIYNNVPVDSSCVLNFGEGQSSTFACSFRAAFRQSAFITGKNESIELSDFVLSGQESTKSSFRHVKQHGLTNADLLVSKDSEVVDVVYPYNQEVFMWEKFAKLCKDDDSSIERAFYAEVSLNTQRVLNALMTSAASKGAVVNL